MIVVMGGRDQTYPYECAYTCKIVDVDVDIHTGIDDCIDDYIDSLYPSPNYPRLYTTRTPSSSSPATLLYTHIPQQHSTGYRRLP